MKGKFMFALAAVGMLALTSCKKDWNCDCEYTVDGTTLEGGVEIQDASKSDAEDTCDSFETTSSAAGQSWDCTLTEK